MTEPAATHPCAQCPWLLTNQGRRHPDGWYTKRNRQRLWVGLRRGEHMSCHPTDVSNPLPEGARAVPEGTAVRECTGALILQQREVMVLDFLRDFTQYRRARPSGLTQGGLAETVSRALFGGTILGGKKMTRPDLNEPVGHEAVPWPFPGMENRH